VDVDLIKMIRLSLWLLAVAVVFTLAIADAGSQNTDNLNTQQLAQEDSLQSRILREAKEDQKNLRGKRIQKKKKKSNNNKSDVSKKKKKNKRLKKKNGIKKIKTKKQRKKKIRNKKNKPMNTRKEKKSQTKKDIRKKKKKQNIANKKSNNQKAKKKDKKGNSDRIKKKKKNLQKKKKLQKKSMNKKSKGGSRNNKKKKNTKRNRKIRQRQKDKKQKKKEKKKDRKRKKMKNKKDKNKKDRKRKNKIKKKDRKRKNKIKKKDKKQKDRKKQERNKKKLNVRQSNATCTKSEVSTDCIESAVTVMTFLQKQVTYFINQYRRIISFNKTINGKLGKNEVFVNASKYVLSSLGGDISNASCGDTGSNNKTEADIGVDMYTELNNCSAAIKDECSMPTDLIPDDVMEKFESFCMVQYEEAKDKAEECRTGEQYQDDGTAACECWENVATILKNTKETGDCDAVKYAKAIKKFKNSCVSKFSSCRKQEDAAVQLVYTCGDGEIEEDSSKSS